MQLIRRSVIADVLNLPEYIDSQLNKIEKAARICYNSKCSETKELRDKFILSIIKSGHESTLEHATLSFIVDTDRACSHQLVRHRLASYSQASMRYIDYTKEKNGGEIKFILDSTTNNELILRTLVDLENKYKMLITSGAKAEDARAILPTCAHTKIYVTMNFREIRHFLKLRLDTHAQLGIRILAVQLFEILNTYVPPNINPILLDLKEEYQIAIKSLEKEPYTFTSLI